jgi:hypothetical protein
VPGFLSFGRRRDAVREELSLCWRTVAPLSATSGSQALTVYAQGGPALGAGRGLRSRTRTLRNRPEQSSSTRQCASREIQTRSNLSP